MLSMMYLPDLVSNRKAGSRSTLRYGTAAALNHWMSGFKLDCHVYTVLTIHGTKYYT